MPNYVSSGTTSIGKGTILYNPYICLSGRVNVSSGGLVSSANIYSGGREYVSAYGSDTDAYVYSNGGLEVLMSGTAVRPYVISSSYISASGGRIFGGTVGKGGILTLKGYDTGSSVVSGYASNLKIISGGSTDIAWKGVGANVEVVSGKVTIYSGGTMQASFIGSSAGDSRGAIVYVKTAGLADANYIHSNGMMYVSAGGTAKATIVRTGGSAIALESGLLSGTIASGGVVDLYPGGSAVSTTIYRDTVESRGGMWVSAGAVATSTTIDNGGILTLESGGVALGSSFLRDGAVSVGSGASVFNFFVSGGDFRVSAGAAASSINVGGGTLRLLDPANGSTGFAYGEWISIYGSGYAYINSGAILSSSFVQAGGSLCVMSGGSANSVQVSSGGTLIVYEGRASNANVFTSGEARIHESGLLSGGKVYGSVTVSTGGTANNMNIQLLGKMTVFGRAVSCTVSSGGQLTLSEGGRLISGIATEGGGTFIVHSGATASIVGESGGDSGYGASATVSGGTAYISAAKLRSAFVENGVCQLLSGTYLSRGDVRGGTLAILSGCSANDVAVYCGGGSATEAKLVVGTGAKTSNGFVSGAFGSMQVSLSGFANSMSIAFDGKATVYGTIDTCFVSSGGFVTVSSGGVASRSTIGSSGFQEVCSGAKAHITVIGKGGELDVYSSGSANVVNVNGGVLTIYSSGSATSAFVRDGGSAFVRGYGRITSANIESGGVMDVLSSGYVYSAFVSSGALLKNSGGLLGDVRVLNGGTVVCNAGTVWGQVSAGGDIVFSGGWTDTLSVSSGGRVRVANYLDFSYSGGIVLFGGTMDFDISNQASPSESVLLDGFDQIDDIDAKGIFTLTVSDTQKEGTYKLASYADTFNKSITVKSIEGADLGTLSIGSKTTIGEYDYTLSMGGSEDVLSVTIEAAVPVPVGTAKSDIDGNGISDVMFVWTGEHGDGNYQHGYWMNGTSEWQSVGVAHPAEWDNLGCYDMSGDGKADSVLFGNVTSEAGIHGAYIGYYADANDLDANWVNIGYLTNEDNIDWKNAVGNLTGNASGANSIVWYTYELGALGVWTDGTENWVQIGSGFDSTWTLIGCGDFNGDGKDQVVMSHNSGEEYHAIDIDGAWTNLGASDSGWTFRAIGDFSGDSKDDIVAFHKETGIVAIWGDGLASNWNQLGQLDAKDWFIVGCGDYNSDGNDDLLVRQISTGMLGYYSSGDMTAWTELGRGVDMNWTVIA